MTVQADPAKVLRPAQDPRQHRRRTHQAKIPAQVALIIMPQTQANPQENHVEAKAIMIVLPPTLIIATAIKVTMLIIQMQTPLSSKIF